MIGEPYLETTSINIILIVFVAKKQLWGIDGMTEILLLFV